jgi:hypothetical protein
VRPAARSSTRAPWLAAQELGRGVAGRGAGRPRGPGGGGTGSRGEERGRERDWASHPEIFNFRM